LAHIGYTTVGVRIFDKFALRRSLDYQLVVILAGAHACDCNSAAMEPRIRYAQTADGVDVALIKQCALGRARFFSGQ
jgi:hypothetical protein